MIKIFESTFKLLFCYYSKNLIAERIANGDLIEGYLGKTVEGKKSRLPAKLDYIQSFTGGFLAFFMWAHMLLVSSILISKRFYVHCYKTLEEVSF